MNPDVLNWQAYELPVLLSSFTISAAGVGCLLGAIVRWARKSVVL